MQAAQQTRGVGLDKSADADHSERSVAALRGLRYRFRRRSAWLVPVCTLALASALVLTLRLVPSYDPYGWLVWGRQTTHLALNPIGAPSWKPMPWLLTTPLSLAGAAAPTLWMILVYASAFVALWLAYRLGARLGGVVAGAVAVVALLLCHDWVIYALTGDSEPLVTALALAAVDRHLAGQHRLALGLGTLVTLARPEAAVVLAPYLLWLWREEPRVRVWEAAAVVVLPLLWLLPPYLATGRRFGASDPALNTGLVTPSPLTVLHRGATIVIFPVAILAVVGLVLALRRGRGRALAMALAAAAGLWAATVAAMAQVGFAGLQRFMLPAAAAGCVLAGAGVGWTLQWLQQAVGRRSQLIVALGLTIIAGLFGWRAYISVADASLAVRDVQKRADALHSLDRAITRAGGANRLLACGFPTADLAFQSALAWRLNRAVGRVGSDPQRDLRREPHVVLFARFPLEARRAHGRLLGRPGDWRIVGVRPRSACFGSRA
jgi:hypothetical protein